MYLNTFTCVKTSSCVANICWWHVQSTCISSVDVNDTSFQGIKAEWLNCFHVTSATWKLLDKFEMYRPLMRS